MKQLTFDLSPDLPIGKSRLEPRTVYDFYINIDGKDYDLSEIYNVMNRPGDYDLHDTEVGEMFLKFDILKSLGSRYSDPVKGQNFEKFKKIILKEMESMWSIEEKL